MKKSNAKPSSDSNSQNDNLSINNTSNIEGPTPGELVIEEIYQLLEEIKKQKDILRSKGIL